MAECCVRAAVHDGFGNWLYIAAEVALVAKAYNCTLVMPDVLHQWFRMPPHVHPPDVPLQLPCQDVPSMNVASSNKHTRTLAAQAMGEKSFHYARLRMFRDLFGLPRVSPQVSTRFRTSVHLRTTSDVHCQTYKNIRNCRRICLREAALRCVVRNALPPVLILSDSAEAGKKLQQLFHKNGVVDVWDESVIVDARNHSGLSPQAAHHAMLLWVAFAAAERRFASSVSTFSKSALLATFQTIPQPHKGTRTPGGAYDHVDHVVDTRCSKVHATDGNLYTCRKAVLARDLV